MSAPLDSDAEPHPSTPTPPTPPPTSSASTPMPTTPNRVNEISSITIPPRSCRQVAESSVLITKSVEDITRPDDIIASPSNRIHLTRALSVDSQEPLGMLSPQLVTTGCPHPVSANNNKGFGRAKTAEPWQNSITINFYRRPLNPVTITKVSNAVVGRQYVPKATNGGACLSMFKPTIQAQECSSEDVVVSVPPVRSEVVLSLSAPQTSQTTTHLHGPVCPRPLPGPMQPAPTAHISNRINEGQHNLTSNLLLKGDFRNGENSQPATSQVAHFNLPRVRPFPYRSLFPATTASAQDSPQEAAISGAYSPCHTSNGSLSHNSVDQISSSSQLGATSTATGKEDINAHITTQHPSSLITQDARGDISNVGKPTKPILPSGTFTASTSSSPGTPKATVSNLPPRPPSLKRPNLGPLQPSGASSTSLASPSYSSSPSSHLSPPRRPTSNPQAGAAVSPVSGKPTVGTPITGSTPITGTTPITSSASRSFAPLQIGLFQRRPSITSQDSVGSCLTPTNSTPPSNLPLGRFPSLQSPSPVAPPMYQLPGVSPVTSPYQDSPSNSRPPSWYSYRMFRGRDSSPSATSRDSLDSFIRSPPSGIFCTRSSVDNLIASRSSMDNISDTSGDSVFDDIMSESEKKSLNDTAESGGSLGSLTLADQSEGAVCLSSPTPLACSAGTPDGGQAKVPSGAGVMKQDNLNRSAVASGEMDASTASDADGGTPSLPGHSSPSRDSQGSQCPLQSLGPESPPSYEEAIGLVPEGASASHLLTYKDFLPTYNTQRRTWEPFNKIVLQANEWLVLNPDVRISSCESVLGFAAQSHGFNPDRAIGTRSQVVHENTYNLRFLRIWYSRLDQMSLDIEPQQIRYANFVSPAENASINTLVDLINTKLNTSIKGDILNVETIYVLRKAIQCPDTLCWIERPHDPKSYSFFLRMFWLEPQEERQELIKLGYMDFVPQHASGKNYPNDYEPFAVLVQVAQWWATHKAEPGAFIINCQSLYVKRKALSTYWQRLHYTESAGGNSFLKNTYYNQILRFYFQTPASSLGVPVSPTLQISYRTFTPVQLTSPTDPCLKFESFGETVNRVLHWLRLSGAQLMSIETIKIRMYGGLQGPHGAESTLMRSEGRRYADQEHWIHCIRVYLVGEYREPDSSRIPPIPHVVPYFTTSPRPVALQPPTLAFP